MKVMKTPCNRFPIYDPSADFLWRIAEHPLTRYSNVEPLTDDDWRIPSERSAQEFGFIVEFTQVANFRLLTATLPR